MSKPFANRAERGYTPGPWKFQHRQLLGDDGRITIARDVVWWNNRPGDSDIFAASPELLERLRECTDALRAATLNDRQQHEQDILARCDALLADLPKLSDPFDPYEGA